MKEKKKRHYHFWNNKVDDDVVLFDEEYDESDDEYIGESDGSDGDMHNSETDSTEGSARSSSDGSESKNDWSECQTKDKDEEVNESYSDNNTDNTNPLKGCEKLFGGPVDENFEWRKSLIFKDVMHIRKLLRDYIVKGGYDVIWNKNDKV